MEKWEIDVPVLCIFFARPEQFKLCFEQVKLAKPKVLLLWQDGPRDGHPDDIQNIMECREIAEDIDWECEVHKNYHDKNLGCDPSTFLSHKWAFSIVDKCIILEDDLVPSHDFFVFCKEMLEKYEYDERVDRICGTNLLGVYDIPYDYFFSSIGNSWGWASWKRVADCWESDYRFIADNYAVTRMRALRSDKKNHEKWENTCKKHREENIPYWEYIIGAECLLNNRLCIYPSRNMICNVGLDKNSTHAPDSIKKVPKTVRQYFNTQTYDIRHSIIHPKYVIDDKVFLDECIKKFNVSSPVHLLSGIVRRLQKITRG